jgi:hypothetical protein
MLVTRPSRKLRTCLAASPAGGSSPLSEQIMTAPRAGSADATPWERRTSPASSGNTVPPRAQPHRAARQPAAAMGRLAVSGRPLTPLTPFKLGVLGNGTLDIIVPVLVGTAIRHGFALGCVIAP